jgi:hypothetical protein
MLRLKSIGANRQSTARATFDLPNQTLTARPALWPNLDGYWIGNASRFSWRPRSWGYGLALLENFHPWSEPDRVPHGDMSPQEIGRKRDLANRAMGNIPNQTWSVANPMFSTPFFGHGSPREFIHR